MLSPIARIGGDMMREVARAGAETWALEESFSLEENDSFFCKLTDRIEMDTRSSEKASVAIAKRLKLTSRTSP